MFVRVSACGEWALAQQITERLLLRLSIFRMFVPLTRSRLATVRATMMVSRNSAAITINDSTGGVPAASTPYGTTINVSGLTGNKIVRMKVNGLSHTFPGDIDMLLVGPAGQKFIPMSDVVGGTDAVNVTFSLI